MLSAYQDLDEPDTTGQNETMSHSQGDTNGLGIANIATHTALQRGLERIPMAPTSQRMISSEQIARQSRFDQLIPTRRTPSTSHHPHLHNQTTRALERPFETTITSHTHNFTEHATTRPMLSSNQPQPFCAVSDVAQSPSVITMLSPTIQKRRASASPEKLTSQGRFEPLFVNTGMPHSKRARHEYGNDDRHNPCENQENPTQFDIETYPSRFGICRVRSWDLAPLHLVPYQREAGLEIADLLFDEDGRPELAEPEAKTLLSMAQQHVSATGVTPLFATNLSFADPGKFVLRPDTPELPNAPKRPTRAPMLGIVELGQEWMRQQVSLRQPDRFSLLSAFCNNNELLHHLVSILPIPSLVDLYAISKTFHVMFNRHATAFVLASSRTWSPQAEVQFPWRCYKSLTIKDPIKRQKAPHGQDVPEQAAADGFNMTNVLAAVEDGSQAVEELDTQKFLERSRDVPSLRWLKMVAWRHGVAQDMVAAVHERGLAISIPATVEAIKRLWFVMDCPVTNVRIAVMHSQSYISDAVLRAALNFFVKVDMVFTDPGYNVTIPNVPVPPRVHITGALRRALLAEQTMERLWRVLRGWSPDPPRGSDWNTHTSSFPALDGMDILRLYARHKEPFDPGTADPDFSDFRVMGMSIGEVNRVRLAWRANRLRHPGADFELHPVWGLDKLLSAEMISRGHKLEHHVWDFMFQQEPQEPVEM